MKKPWRITIDTNPDQCNLNCIMCDTHSIYNFNFKPRREPMSRELLEKCVDEALNLEVKEIIPTTMGEPLLYKYFDVFIEKLSQSNTKLNLTTNGTFPNIGVEKWAEKLLPILSDIKISINSINKKVNESIMVNDSTDKKIVDIKKFVKLRDNQHPNVSITLQVTFLKSNLNDLEELIKFAIEYNINRVKGHHLWITYDGIKDESLSHETKKIEEWNVFVEKIEKYREQINLVNFDKIKPKDKNGDINKEYNCLFLGSELWIDYNGDFNICCVPSDKRISLGSWGNIENTSIENIFNSESYLKLIQNYKTKAICKICTLRRV